MRVHIHARAITAPYISSNKVNDGSEQKMDILKRNN